MAQMEATTPEERICIYIDAANFYHIVLKILSLGELDFDFDKFADHLMRGRRGDGSGRRYYVGTVREEVGNEYSKEAMSKQTKQLDLLKKSKWDINTSRLRRRIESIKIDGRTKEHARLKAAGFRSITVERYREKGIDVKLATDLLSGAFDDKYDVAVVVSSDSDLIPAIDRVRFIQKKKVEYVGFSIQNPLNPENPTKPTQSLIEKSDIQNIILEEDVRKFVKPRLKGIVVENSLRSKKVLEKIEISSTRQSGNWIIHEVTLRRDQVSDLKKELQDGWYMHFWVPGHDDIVVIFRRKIFTIKHSDKATWTDCIAYGKSLEIPDEQLDFLIT
jgi:uncharacterized LabA/DUF88 family protein